jgi:hypothetical protein
MMASLIGRISRHGQVNQPLLEPVFHRQNRLISRDANPPRGSGHGQPDLHVVRAAAPYQADGRLLGCTSEGDSLDEARQNVREAIALYLEAVEEPVPPEGGLVEEIVV